MCISTKAHLAMALKTTINLPGQQKPTARDPETRYQCQTLCTVMPALHRPHTDSP